MYSIAQTKVEDQAMLLFVEAQATSIEMHDNLEIEVVSAETTSRLTISMALSPPEKQLCIPTFDNLVPLLGEQINYVSRVTATA